MTASFAFAILVAIFAFGEIIAEKTKAVLSATLVIAITLLIAFWFGLPSNIFDTAALTAITNILIGMLITSLGSMIDFPELKRQWKTVVVSFLGMLAGVSLILLVAPVIIGREMTIAGSPIFAGANTAALLMINSLNEKGLTELSSFVIMVLITQNFIGIPIASILLRKDAKSFLKDSEQVKLYAQAEQKAQTSVKRKPLQLPAILDRPSIRLLKLALVSGLSQKLAGLTNGNIHWFVWCLLLGVLCTELGFLEKNILPKTDSNAFIIFSTTVIIFTNLAQTTPDQLLRFIWPLLVVLIIGVIGVFIVGFLVSKALKMSPGLGISLGLTCTFGFPTTMLMSKEVAKAIGSTDEERIAIENYILPKMVTAGFVTVTITSVLIAGVVVGML
ncbi:MAG: hypothetical protein ACOX0K_07425 [Oscillospiraceae bacterium]|jgi:hypothetical protein